MRRALYLTLFLAPAIVGAQSLPNTIPNGTGWVAEFCVPTDYQGGFISVCLHKADSVTITPADSACTLSRCEVARGGWEEKSWTRWNARAWDNRSGLVCLAYKPDSGSVTPGTVSAWGIRPAECARYIDTISVLFDTIR